jgi:hypothetical protein
MGKCVANPKLQDLVENGNQSLTTFGVQENVDIDVSTVRPFVLSLYGIKSRNCSLVDQLRYFLASTTDKSASHLTPTEDATLNIDTPIGNRWYMSDGQLEPCDIFQRFSSS